MPESDPEDFLTPALASEPGLLAPDRDLDLDFTWTNSNVSNITDSNKMTLTPGPNTTGLLETLFIYIFSRLAQASVQALYNLSSSPVVLGPGSETSIN